MGHGFALSKPLNLILYLKIMLEKIMLVSHGLVFTNLCLCITWLIFIALYHSMLHMVCEKIHLTSPIYCIVVQIYLSWKKWLVDYLVTSIRIPVNPNPGIPEF